MFPGLIPSAGRNCDFGSISWPRLRTGVACTQRSPRLCLTSSWPLEPRLLAALARNPVRTAGNHPLAALKWNHKLNATYFFTPGSVGGKMQDYSI